LNNGISLLLVSLRVTCSLLHLFGMCKVGWVLHHLAVCIQRVRGKRASALPIDAQNLLPTSATKKWVLSTGFSPAIIIVLEHVKLCYEILHTCKCYSLCLCVFACVRVMSPFFGGVLAVNACPSWRLKSFRGADVKVFLGGSVH